MTNKKFKVAAMSMALTACVAAQPLIANAADEEINPNDENVNKSQSEGESPASAPVAAASESSSNTEVKDEDKQDMLAPDEHLGEYGKPETDTDGNSTSKADITKDAPEQEQEPEIDGDSDGTGSTGSTGSEIKEQIPIGESTLTETPGQSSTVVTPNPGAEPMPDPTKPPEVTTNPDGSTDIETSTVTPGTETTTTTASGEVNAESHTKEETSGDQINLDTELGETKPDWNTEKDAKFNGYNVDNVEPSKDGNSKTLTLTKTERLEGQMGSEELAKFTNSTKKNNGDGTYDLVRTETYTDENGQQRTRTTTLHVKDNEVIVDTTITLIVALEKGKHESEPVDTSKVVLPEITVTGSGESFTIDQEKLARLMGSTTPTTDAAGNNIYTVTDGDLTYTITETKGENAAAELTNEEMFALLDHKNFKLQDGKIYYIGNGENAELSLDQTNALRRTLSYSVTAEKTVSGDVETDGKKPEAEAAAKTEARNNAVINALKQMGLSDEDAKAALAPGKGTFNETDHTFTYTLNGKTYTLNYTEPTASEDPSNVTDLPNEPGKTDTQQHTVTGTAQVINGTVSWTDSGSGSGKCSEISGKPWTKPDGATKVKTDHDGNKTITTYKVTSTDGKTVTTYVVTEEEVPLSDAEKNELAVRLAWEQLEKQTGKTRTELEADGYKIDNPIFTGSTKNISWTATQKQTTTSKTEESVSDIIYVDGDKKWTIDESDGTITVDGTTYTISQKNADGSYTCDVIDPNNNQKTSYTFTETDSATSLTDPQVKALLVDKLASDFPGITANDIQLSTDGKTASYTKNGKTVTIDYSKLGKALEVKKEEHHTSSTVVTIKKDENYDTNFWNACQELLNQIKATQLDEGQEIWIGNTQITESTTLTEDLIKYFTKAVSSTDMSKEELIKALQAQAAEAQKTYVKVNEGKTDFWGNSYEETLRNYYSGANKDGTYYVKPDGSVQKLKYDYRAKKFYYKDSTTDEKIYPDDEDIVTYNHPDDIGHLDLASGSQLELLPDEQDKVETTDCVLISKDLKLEWNYEADDLVKDRNNTTVSLEDEITFDSEDGKKGSGHYEYNRGSNYEKTIPTKSAYYKLTGTVVYDAVKDSDGNVTKYRDLEDAKDAYCTETGRAYNTVSAEDFAKYVVKVGDKYQVYTKSSQLEAYGYMTRDANTCVNQTYYRQYDSFDYCGGYDLMISKLTQVREGMVVGQTSSDIKTITAPWSIRTTEKKTDHWLKLNKKTTETTTTNENPNFGSGSGSTTNGNYSYTYTQDHANTLDSSVTGTGTGTYTSFRKLLTRIFTGSGQGHEDSGSFQYTYRTEKDAVLTPVSKVTKVDKTAHITYDRTTVESRDVLIPGTETVHIDPDDDGGDEIIEEKDPDSPVLPGTPELPPVQDAKPDAPVPPADPVLPAVQGAHALPQTGVNWLAAIGLALSGMTLMITGAFASLLGKNAKH
ncbi:MAG: hypothetical protein MR946_00615 [Faecalibacterium sp.]|nr:hypothetical protein [Faecalibacterium sp.]